MRHRISGKRLSRTTSHRKAMRRNMAASLFEHGAVRTTPRKAKELRPFVERLITLARSGTLHARRRAIALLGDRAMVDKENPGELADQTVVQKLFDDIAPRYVDRPGGYTRIIHLPERRIGDASEQVLLQLVEEAATAGAETQATAARRRKRAAQRADHARAAVEDAEAPAGDDEGETPDEQAQADEQGPDDERVREDEDERDSEAADEKDRSSG